MSRQFIFRLLHQQRVARLFVLVALPAALLVVTATAYSQTGSTDGGFTSPLPTPAIPDALGVVPGAAQYAEAFNVSEDEAARRLALQVDMSALVAEIADHEPQFAAAWFVHTPDFGLIVAFTTPNGDVKLRKYLDDPAWSQWADIVDAAQSPLSHGELVSIQHQLYNVERKTDIPFESGVAFPPGKIHIYTPQVDAMTAYLESLPSLKNHLEHVEVIYQEKLSEIDSLTTRPQGAPPVATPQPYSSQAYGGVALSGVNGCTAGYVFRSAASGKRYISTAGHCTDEQRTESMDLGRVVYQYQYSHDVQFHDIFKARGGGLTNEARLGPLTASVTDYQFRGSLYGDWVCKQGRVSHQTCGWVTDTDYRPSVPEEFDDTFVKAQRVDNNHYMGCGGDSGAPVYQGYRSNSVIAVGIFTGSQEGCEKTETYFFFSDLGDIFSRAGVGNEYLVLTEDYSAHFYQSIFYSNGVCKQYTGEVNNSGGFDNWHEIPCNTYAPGSGTVTTYTNWVVGDKLHEALWRGGKGYVRANDLNTDGTVNWNGTWQQVPNSSSAVGQGAYVVGDKFEQHVYLADNSCEKYTADLDDDGNFYNWSGPNACPAAVQNIPGSGTVSSYTNYVIGDTMREAMVRGGNNGYRAFIRSTPILSSGTIDWGNAGVWQECYSCAVGPLQPYTVGQGAYILWHR